MSHVTFFINFGEMESSSFHPLSHLKGVFWTTHFIILYLIFSLQESTQFYQKMMEEGFNNSCSESEMDEPWTITDNLVKGCVQYFVPGWCFCTSIFSYVNRIVFIDTHVVH